MKIMTIKKNSTIKMSTPSCSCTSPCPVHKTKLLDLTKEIGKIYAKRV